MEEPLSRRGGSGRRRAGRLRRCGRCPGSAGRGRAAVTIRRAIDIDVIRADLGWRSGLRSAGGSIELEHGREADEVRRGCARASPRRKRVQRQEHRRRKGGSQRSGVVLASKRSASPEESRRAFGDVACRSSGGKGSASFDEELSLQLCADRAVLGGGKSNLGRGAELEEGVRGSRGHDQELEVEAPGVVFGEMAREAYRGAGPWRCGGMSLERTRPMNRIPSS
jgi:hypothetical protein